MSEYWQQFWLSHGYGSAEVDEQAQVLRTLERQPVKPEMFSAIVTSVCQMLAVQNSSDLLDLCCGNGVITREFFYRCSSITAVDLVPEFVARLLCEAPDSVSAIVADARSIEFPQASFDRILLYSGLQYFSHEETVHLFERLRLWLRADGRIVLGDILDVSRQWEFFSTIEREAAYFNGLKIGAPLIGTWFDAGWLIKLAQFSGFGKATVYSQPQSFPYQHYRFDMVLRD